MMELLDTFPEINFLNYTEEEVHNLQEWALVAYDALMALRAAPEHDTGAEAVAWMYRDGNETKFMGPVLRLTRMELDADSAWTEIPLYTQPAHGEREPGAERVVLNTVRMVLDTIEEHSTSSQQVRREVRALRPLVLNVLSLPEPNSTKRLRDAEKAALALGIAEGLERAAKLIDKEIELIRSYSGDEMSVTRGALVTVRDSIRALAPAKQPDAEGGPLRWLLNELQDREDIRDGGDGQQLPNEAMSILTDFDRKFPNLRAALPAVPENRK